MGSFFYEIYLKDYDKTLVFCKKEEYKKQKTNKIFTNIYIYGDDTLVEVINKIKISIIENIEEYDEDNFKELAGFLSADWNYYSEFKKEEYLSYNLSIDHIDDNELVIGYYNVNKNYNYYVVPNYFLRLIENNTILENEYNKPINSYVNYDKDLKKNIITNFNFEINKNELFVKYNNFQLFNNIKNDLYSEYELLSNLYRNIDINKKNLEIKNDIDIKDIYKYLSLEIYNNESLNLIEYFENIELNKNYPICILNYKEKKKINKYKLFSNDDNDVPFIKMKELNNILKKKSKVKENNILIKYFYNKNYYDIYIYENKYINIILNFEELNILNIKLENILIIINKILKDLNLKVGFNNSIKDINELIYYNNNNYIKINNNNEIISSINRINVDLSKYINKKNIEEDYIKYVSLFNTYYDLNLKTVDVLYKNDDEQIISDSIKYVRNCSDDWTIALNKSNEEIYDFNKIKLQNKNLKLFYKKSKNYNSYNYLRKFYKHIMTFNQEKQITLLNCNWSDYSNEKFKNYLFNNDFNLEFDYNNININSLLYNIPKEDKEYCKNILYSSERKTELNVNIYLNTLQIDIKNYGSFIELENIKSTINEFINFINLQNDFIFKLNENLYYDLNDKIYNIYNNIYNLYNYQDNTNINEYYIYVYLKKLEDERLELKKTETTKQIKVSTNIKLFDDDSEDESDDSIVSPVLKDDVDSDSDESSESIFSDDDLDSSSIENYKNELEYKTNYYNTNKQLSNTFFDKEYNELCKLEKRPSIISKENIEVLHENERKGLINVNNKKTKYFTNLINVDENIIKLEILNDLIILEAETVENLLLDKKTLEEKTIEEKTNITKLSLFKGREYIIKIKYNNDDEQKNKLILAEKFYIPSSYDFKFNVNNIITKDIKYKKNNEELTYEEYLNDTGNEFEIIFNYIQTIQNDESCISLCLLSSDKLLTKIEDYDGNMYNFYSNNNPKKYYYNRDLYGENYFVCLPGRSSSSKQLHSSDYAPNFISEGSSGICCMKKDKHKITDIKDNYKKKPYKFNNENTDILDENDYKLKHLKLGKIPINIYDNINKFLNLDHKENKYTDLELKNGHMYRLGIIEDNNISNLILSILYTVKYENLQGKINFIKNNKYFTDELIKNMFTNYLNSLDINELINYNNGIYYQFPDNLIKISELVYDNKKLQSLNTSKREEIIRKGLIEYIDKKFLNLDMNLVINMLSNIFKLNIIIIEIINQDTIINTSIKCNNLSKNNINYDNYCILLKIKDIYQPLIMYDENKKNIFKIVFSLKDEQSNSNIKNLYNKCLLNYNNSLYKNLLINSVYFNIPIDDYLILDDSHLTDLLEKNINIQYVININFVKIGLLLSYKDLDELYIPLNYLKHNINYLNIINNKTINYIWFDNIKTNNIIKNFKDTTKLIQEYYNIHNNDLLNINNKFITHNIDSNVYIIGIGLNINEFIPIQNELLTNVKLQNKDLLIGYTDYISNSKTDTSIIKDFRDNNINTTIYYRKFLEFISNLIEKNKLNTNKIDDIISKNPSELKKYLNDILENLIEEVDYLDEMKLIETNNYNYTLDNLDEDNKFVITEDLYDIFLNYLIFDLINNNYRKNQIFNNLFNKKIIVNDSKNNIILDEKTLNNESIYELYNNILSDKFSHIIGEKYNVIKENNYGNIIYCNNKTSINDDEGKQYIYYNFKKLLKNNDINYSNCIYYHIGKNILKFKNNIVKQTRELISKQIISSIQQNNLSDYFIDLTSILQHYTEESNTNIYNNIETLDALNKIIISDSHWITYLDLVALTQVQPNINLNIMYCNNNNNIIDKFFKISNNQKKNKDTYYIYKNRFYNKSLYFYMEPLT